MGQSGVFCSPFWSKERGDACKGWLVVEEFRWSVQRFQLYAAYTCAPGVGSQDGVVLAEHV